MILEIAEMVMVPFDRQQANLSEDGYRRFVKGRHQEALNLGDCVFYALAQFMHDPILFKGRI